MDLPLCYLRYRGKNWEPAPTVYRRILQLYEELQSDRRSRQPDPVTICTTRRDGSIMMVYVRAKPHTSGVYLCQEQMGDGGSSSSSGSSSGSSLKEETVELMRSSVALGRERERAVE